MRYTAFGKVAILITLLVSPLPLGGSQAADTLKDRARAHGGKTSSSVHADLPFASLTDVVSRANVVVRARIQEKESRLTNDGNFVRTYYTFSPTRTFKDTVGINPKRRTPQMTIPLVFFESGGLVKVEGLQIHQTSNTAVDPPLNVGDDVVLLLDWDKDANAFRLQNGPYGLLRVHGETVAEATKATKRGLAGKSVSDIEAEIERLVKGVPVG